MSKINLVKHRLLRPKNRKRSNREPQPDKPISLSPGLRAKVRRKSQKKSRWEKFGRMDSLYSRK